MKDEPNLDPKYAFEELKLFYDSTEKVTDRRLSANRWNYSICTAIIVAIAALINWGLSKPDFLVVSVVAVILLAGMATLFCSLWIGQIRDFKALNNAKFGVLNLMARQTTFSDSPSDPRISYCPFEKEWKFLEEAKAIGEVSSQKIIALKASNIEYLIPKAFRILFIGIIISMTLIIGLNWKYIFNSSTLTIQAHNLLKAEL